MRDTSVFYIIKNTSYPGVNRVLNIFSITPGFGKDLLSSTLEQQPTPVLCLYFINLHCSTIHQSTILLTSLLFLNKYNVSLFCKLF